MSVNFLDENCQTISSKKLFGLCDPSVPTVGPAYIDEEDGAKWIGVVVNEYLYNVTFTAIDHCIDIRLPNNTQAKRCDGVLTYNNTAIFVELKDRPSAGNNWVKDAEQQLRSTINHFENTNDAAYYTEKKAYIANSGHPKFKSSQIQRMEKFRIETGYVLRIENRITL
ncbi:hypothetical protein [Olivibacter sp. XZL3]|uniref:hypothetical protein n=1 Tax=Olivibacter sp. XZL3 TaxID=1735116 RepID=UPI0010653A53|nr:hypothetical protein [Olivibacter sp. XZL3]